MPAATEEVINPSTGMPVKIWRVGTLTYTAMGLVILFSWLLWGDFAWSMKERTVVPVLQLLLKKFEASDLLTGILLGSFPPMISMILGPIISYKSDHHRGPWGRRIPFLVLSTPVAALAMVGLAYSPFLGEFFHENPGFHILGKNGTTLFFFGLFWTVFEFSTVIGYSLFGALINDVVPQSVLGRFYGAFRGLSLIAGIAFNYWLYGKARTEYFWIFIAMAVLYGAGFTMMCLKVKEGGYPPPPPPNPARGITAFLVAAKGYFKKCFSHSYYWWYFATGAVTGVSMMPFNLYNVAYAEMLHVDLDPTYKNCVALTYAISLVLAYPLGALADRLHPLRLVLFVQFLYVLMTLCGGLLVTDATSFAVALVAHGVLAGTWLTAAASLGQRLLPKTDFAQFGSAGGIVGSLLGIVAAPAVGEILDLSHHNYRLTFFMSSGLALIAFILSLVVYTKFVSYGGPKNYVAPTWPDEKNL